MKQFQQDKIILRSQAQTKPGICCWYYLPRLQLAHQRVTVNFLKKLIRVHAVTCLAPKKNQKEISYIQNQRGKRHMTETETKERIYG